MNRPREVLLAALSADLAPLVRTLREIGWPAEATVFAEPFRVEVVVPLEGIPVPVESQNSDSANAEGGG